MVHWRRESVLDLYKIAIGLFFFISPWLLAYHSGVARTDAWAASALVMLASIAALVVFSDWEEWLSLLVGLWLIAAPWILGFTHTRAMVVSIGVGAAFAFIAGLELWLVHCDPQPSQDGSNLEGRQSR
jgi:hypothetical protein